MNRELPTDYIPDEGDATVPCALPSGAAGTAGAALMRVVARYFADPSCRLTLQPGEVLLLEGASNRRLFHVVSGELQGTAAGPDGAPVEMFVATPGDLVGLPSVFSGDFTCRSTVQARTVCELAWWDWPIAGEFGVDESRLARATMDFMPAVVEELGRRQVQLRDLHLEQARMAAKMQEIDKLVSLGQLAAGVAHELNNSLTVLDGGVRTLREDVEVLLEGQSAAAQIAWQAGLEQGRRLSSAEVRRRAAELERSAGLTRDQARRLAQTGLEPSEFGVSRRHLAAHADELRARWEMGAVLHDMALASSQSQHVIQSMRTLGVRHREREPAVDLAETVHAALSLLHGPLTGIQVNVDLPALPTISANVGELVQIWSNLVRNAADALQGAGVPSPTITITGRRLAGELELAVSDNGPGVPAELVTAIFQPNVTTRKRGLSFGLGLGLTLTERLVTAHGGRISLDGPGPGATFRVALPCSPDGCQAEAFPASPLSQ